MIVSIVLPSGMGSLRVFGRDRDRLMWCGGMVMGEG